MAVAFCADPVVFCADTRPPAATLATPTRLAAAATAANR
ncbi:MAG: hypothetical protein J07HB67_00420 [halophilic archaeon J07HB67]|nr:MAG: hypothetical protein J07HB67_00420 [halophilic archaeon J07HB67]